MNDILLNLGIIGGIVLAVLAFLQKVRQGGKKEAQQEAKLEAAVQRNEAVELSNETVEQAESRRDPAAHSADGIVPNASIPDWSKRQ